MNNTPDFKKAFEAAELAGLTVMEGGVMEDYFHITVCEIHEHLSNYVEFAARCANADDMVGLEEVCDHIANLNDILAQVHKGAQRLKDSLKDRVALQRAAELARPKVTHDVETLVGLMENELGVTINVG